MDDKTMVEWSNLPEELWVVICKHLNTAIDFLRFRSTCRLWRNLLPLPSSYRVRIPHGEFSLFQTKTYRLEPLPHHPHHTNQKEDSSSSCSKGWIIKVTGESKKPFSLHLLDPFTNVSLSRTDRRIFSPEVLNLNFMNFRVVELFEEYTLKRRIKYSIEIDEDAYMYEYAFDGEGEHEFDSFTGVSKVVLFQSFPVEDRMVFTLHSNRTLCVSKIGDENWTILMNNDVNNNRTLRVSKIRYENWAIVMNDDDDDDDDENNNINNNDNMIYEDIILHKGQLYVVDIRGTIWWINCSTLKLVQFSPMLYSSGQKKHLVESGGSLYVVDKFIGETIKRVYEVCDIKVYKLDEEWGRWLVVKDLGDVLFVLGRDSNFSLSAQDYYGCQGNCVYFYNRSKVCAFSLENSKFHDSPNPFWPCPTLFH